MTCARRWTRASRSAKSCFSINREERAATTGAGNPSPCNLLTMRTAAVLTVSDSSARGERADVSGPATGELLRQNGFEVTEQKIVPDDHRTIESALIHLSERVQLIVTTGGTGLAVRDVT